MKKIYIPKLRATREHVEEIAVEIEKIRSDASLLPRMFRTEAADRNRINAEKDEAKASSEHALAERASLIKQISDLTSERDRKKQLAI